VSPNPTRDNPFGIAFPGLTYNEQALPNWVGHFVTGRPELLVYDYAFGGSTVSGVKNQVLRQFAQHVGQKPEWAPWTAEDTLFVTWVGINDCSYTTDYTRTMAALLTLQEALYAHGARNFLFIDVPPVDRSPAAITSSFDLSPRFKNWNTGLRAMVSEFHGAHADVTAFVFSSWDTFTRVLDDPVGHGFPKDDVQKFGGSIWVDHLHPSSAVHKVVARGVAGFLDTWPAYVGS